MEVILSDPSNASGYIEGSRLVCGSYFTPTNDAELEVSWEPIESSTNERNDATDLISTLGIKSRKMSFSMQHMTPSDRNSVVALLKSNGLTRPMFISLAPEDDDISTEQLYQMYGKLSKTSAVAIAYWNAYSTSIEIEEN
jgi:hypothetical protein